MVMLPGSPEWAGISLELTTWLIDLCSCFQVPIANKVKNLDMYHGWVVRSGIISFGGKKTFLFSHCTKKWTRERCLWKRMKSPFVFSIQIFWSVLAPHSTSAWLMCSWRAVLVPSLGRFSLFLGVLITCYSVTFSPFPVRADPVTLGRTWVCRGQALNPRAAVGAAPGLWREDYHCPMQSYRAVGTGRDVGTWSEQWHNSSLPLPPPFHCTCLWDLCWVADTYPPVAPLSSFPNGRWSCFWWVLLSGISKPLKKKTWLPSHTILVRSLIQVFG